VPRAPRRPDLGRGCQRWNVRDRLEAHAPSGEGQTLTEERFSPALPSRTRKASRERVVEPVWIEAGASSPHGWAGTALASPR
jgi:hypothetical protein